jgi:hypothetical protein
VSEYLQVELNTQYHDAQYLRGELLVNAMQVDVSSLLAAATRAVQPGLQALRTNVNAIRARSGRLGRSPGTKSKIYGGGSRRTVTALVGYRSGIAPHAYYVEFGTKDRSKRGRMAGKLPLQRAFETARPAMENAMTRELQDLMAKAANAVR